MIVFFTSEIENNFGYLIEDELHHCSNVLRKKVGDDLFVTDGHGHLFNTKIVEASKKLLKFEIKDKTYFNPPEIKNCIALSPPKSADRLEFFVEKAIECGILKIILFYSSRSERNRINKTRLDKIAISAMKQSRQYHLAKIDILDTFDKAIIASYPYDQKFIAHLNNKSQLLKSIYNSDKSAFIFIGPEGDFTNDEISVALEKEFTEVTLGNSVLRTETAGIYAAVIIS